MIDMTALKQIFAEKLQQTDSFDEALKKACWVAYQSKSEWISVNDRVPDIGEKVLTCDALLSDGGFVCDYNFRIENDSFVGWRYGYLVTHWMPLPEPPKASD